VCPRLKRSTDPVTLRLTRIAAAGSPGRDKRKLIDRHSSVRESASRRAIEQSWLVQRAII